MGASWLPVVVMVRLEKEIAMAIERWRAGAMHCTIGTAQDGVFECTRLCQRGQYKSHGRPSRVRNRDGLANPRQLVSA